MSNLDEARKKAAEQKKKWQRREKRDNILIGFLVGLAVVAVIAAAFALGGLIFYIAWNLGVVNIVAACGGSVASINFWTAIGGSLAVGLLSRIFGRKPAVEAKS